jgi:hypothetical protein
MNIAHYLDQNLLDIKTSQTKRISWWQLLCRFLAVN